MPGAMLQHEQVVMESTVEIEPEDDTLWFLSDRMPTIHSVLCHPGLEQKENLLQEAQCWDVLASIWSLIRAEAAVYNFCNANLWGQEVLGWAANVLDAWKEMRLLAVVKYWRSRKALLALREAGPWTQELCKLHKKDMSTMYRAVLDTQEKVAQAESSLMCKCKKT